jgi:hypothetical protein
LAVRKVFSLKKLWLSHRGLVPVVPVGWCCFLQLQHPRQSAGLIPKFCAFLHKLFTGAASSSGAGTEAKIIPDLNKQKGARKRMNSFGFFVVSD